MYFVHEFDLTTMYVSKRVIQLVAFTTTLTLIALVSQLNTGSSWHRKSHFRFYEEFPVHTSTYSRPGSQVYKHGEELPWIWSSHFRPGTPKSSGSNHTRVMVIPRMKEEDITWISDELPDIDLAVYVANDPTAPLHPPKNKGHEVIIYLTYIIDHYDDLPDVIVFMHAHRWTHHNNEFLGYDAVEMLHRLSSAHVVREGYVNMRCHWNPGCPEWLHPVSTQEFMGKQEETVLSRCWAELFPLDPLPQFLAQPCCAQFALSKERVRSIPISRFVFFRDWILRTPLSDYISGRIWEYSWQFVFTGQNVYCPAEHYCYCDGFGLCFGGEIQYKDFLQLRYIKQEFESELRSWLDKEKILQEATRYEDTDTSASVKEPDPERISFLKDQIRALGKEIAARKEDALQRGANPRYRAEESGRQWAAGDGF